MNRRAKKLIERFAADEDSFCSRRFLAPKVPGGMIHVRLGGVVCKLKVAPKEFRGFAVFETISFTEAIWVRDATLMERKSYLESLPKVSLIAASRATQGWLAAAAHQGDRRFLLNGLVLVQLADNIDLFDTIECRFDGSTFWFERASARANPRHADGLRKALLDKRTPNEVEISGLTAEHRAVYEMQYRRTVEPDVKDEVESEVDESFNSDLHRVQESLTHAGAKLVGIRDRNGALQVSYTVDDRSFTSAVDRDSLGLISAGVCLDGLDHEFDLTSLVGVLREGVSTHQV